jgi:4-amino-4-deoxy-L-arabinose transferase-like glycosyltransferase
MAAVVGAVLAAVLLGMQLPADPATGVTFSMSPFTDEGWSVLPARNQVLLGRWIVDDWPLVWVQAPFSAVMAAVFSVFGVGIVQARLVSVVASVLAVGLVGAIVARRFGEAAGVVAAVGMATCALFLYYGRLALLEPMVTLLLVAGTTVVVSRPRIDRSVRFEAGVGLAAALFFGLAIATKASAAAAVVGILVGAALASAGGRDETVRLRRRLAAAAVGTAAIGIAYAAIVMAQPGLTHAIARIWPDATGPASIVDAITRAIGYVRGSDHAIGLTAPLIAGSLLAIGLLVVRWGGLPAERRILAGAVIGWLVAGMGVLLIVDYRPNRYVVPMVPAMAALTGIGAGMALELLADRRARWRRGASMVVAVAVIATLLSARGVGTLAGWMGRATYRLPDIQAEVLDLANDGTAIQGAVTMAMRVPVPTLIVQGDVNAGDLYASPGVRWLLTNRDATPAWAASHPDAWAARRIITCYPWPSGEACLIRVP